MQGFPQSRTDRSASGRDQQFVKDYKVKTIFVEKHTSSKVADSIAKATGGVSGLDPLEADPQNDKDLLENLEENMATFSQELEE